MADIVTQPIKFLGGTVLSFNTSLGLGSAQESSLNVDIVEDCEAGDRFLPAYNEIEVGAPVYFSTGIDGAGFSFGGVLTNWTFSQGGSGRTFNAKVVDPRQLLENVIVVIDSYNGPPIKNPNYFNIYAQLEGGGCGSFGASGSSEKGTPYNSIINALKSNGNPTICSTTGYNYTINFDSFPPGAPDFYRIPGPSITILQLLQSICDVLGLEFYVYMTMGVGIGGSPIGIINIGTIDLKIAPPANGFGNIIKMFDGKATDLSYGEELRNEVTKTIIFGEKQHYLSPVAKFNFYFGEEWDGNDFVPILPHAFEKCYGFWIKKRIPELNVTLNRPLPGIGPYTISEQDMRAAMSSFGLWKDRVYDKQIKGSLNAAIRANTPLEGAGPKRVIEAQMNDPSIPADRHYRAINDASLGPTKQKTIDELFVEDLQKIHQFVQNLAETYYGKQWFVPLNETVCYYKGEKFQEKIFSSEPTNAGGWVDYGTPVLGLADPDLGTFRQTDDRISCFAVFAINDDDVPDKDKKDNYGQDNYGENNYGSGSQGGGGE